MTTAHRALPSDRVAVIGAGPAGLMAAQTLAAAGVGVDVYDAMPSVGRKFLRAGVGGLNLTHAEDAEQFRRRFAGREQEVGRWLDELDADAVRQWAADLGISTFVGTSGRVFPEQFKAAPLLRAWLRQLRAAGVQIHVRQRWTGFGEADGVNMVGPTGLTQTLQPVATVLALGGGSWPQLGSDGAWVEALRVAGAKVNPLRPANCGFELSWSAHLLQNFAGQPLKPVILRWVDRDGGEHSQQGELMITRHGLEGGLIYAQSAGLRTGIEADGSVLIELDLLPGRSADVLLQGLRQPRGSMSWSSWLRRRAGLDPLRVALLFEAGIRPMRDGVDIDALAHAIKRLPLRLTGTRPLVEAISSAGGVCFESLDAQQMLRTRPRVFCAGEMLDWEAPTGGYLLTASLASGKAAGLGVLQWLRGNDGEPGRWQK